MGRELDSDGSWARYKTKSIGSLGHGILKCTGLSGDEPYIKFQKLKIKSGVRDEKGEEEMGKEKGSNMRNPSPLVRVQGSSKEEDLSFDVEEDHSNSSDGGVSVRSSQFSGRQSRWRR